MYQFIAVCVSCAWSFAITFLLAKLIHFIPFFELRLTEKDEELGADRVELGETACKHQLKKLVNF